MEFKTEQFIEHYRNAIRDAISKRQVGDIESQYKHALYFIQDDYYSDEKEKFEWRIYRLARAKELGLQFRKAKAVDSNFTSCVKNWAVRLKNRPGTCIKIFPEEEYNFYWTWHSRYGRIMNGGFIIENGKYSHT